VILSSISHTSNANLLCISLLLLMCSLKADLQGFIISIPT
jgi:hypothetical protein